MTIEIISNELKERGSKKYETHPKVGEWIEMCDEFGMASFYSVVMVAHSSEGNGSDLYVKKLGINREQVAEEYLLS